MQVVLFFNNTYTTLKILKPTFIVKPILQHLRRIEKLVPTNSNYNILIQFLFLIITRTVRYTHVERTHSLLDPRNNTKTRVDRDKNIIFRSFTETTLDTNSKEQQHSRSLEHTIGTRTPYISYESTYTNIQHSIQHLQPYLCYGCFQKRKMSTNVASISQKIPRCNHSDFHRIPQ